MPKTLLASKGTRLARRKAPLTTGAMERFLRRWGIPGVCYSKWTGGQSLKEFIAMNPSWTQRKWEELILENLDILKADEEFCTGLGAH